MPDALRGRRKAVEHAFGTIKDGARPRREAACLPREIKQPGADSTLRHACTQRRKERSNEMLTSECAKNGNRVPVISE
jgi:hypothetical protein